MHSFSSTPSAPPQFSMYSLSTLSAPYQSSMPSFKPGAPPQSNMHNRATPSAPYQSSMPNFRLGAPFQAKTSSATQFAPSQTRIHQSYPNVTPHARTKNTTQNLGAHQNSSSSNPKPRQKKTRVVTSETLKASKNASRYMEAIRHGGSQSSMHGPRK